MRGKQATKKKISADPIYNSTTITKFINYLMLSGKKTLAERLVYKALEKAGEESKLKPMEVFEKALENLKPKMEVRSRRVGGANYQVPVQVDALRQESLAMRWLISAARESRKTTDFSEALAKEIINATKKEGAAYKKKEDTHKMADANKAFEHFQW